jgi:hypothetical protein
MHRAGALVTTTLTGTVRGSLGGLLPLLLRKRLDEKNWPSRTDIPSDAPAE